jgi:hypothetical protein
MTVKKSSKSAPSKSKQEIKPTSKFDYDPVVARKKTIPKPKRKSVPPKLEMPPKPRKVDYDIAVEDGTLGDDYSIYRVKVIADGIEVNQIGEGFVSCGFGQTPGKAVEDFINRNNSNILNKIFDKEEK